MSKIRGKNTRVELLFYKELRKRGITGFRRHYDAEGKPDFAFPKRKIAVFIDGGFWHGKDFLKWKRKLSRFWLNKITNNMKRDRIVKRRLARAGWTLVRFWDSEVKRNVAGCVEKLEPIFN
jgi:DNA mismatch endonuclease (patch repair protein)